METRRDVIVRAAMLADELGYEIFAVPEGWGLNAAPVLTGIALRTQRIRLASGVLSVWGRTPATLAMTAATLHQVCGGRYLLGLGTSTKALAEGFHDTAFEHPAAKLRDAVTKVRALLAGQAAQLGQVPAARPLRLGQPPAPDLPIWVAALGRHTTRGAAELGDGWMPALVARDRLPRWTAQLKPLPDAARGRRGLAPPRTRTPPRPATSPQPAPPGTWAPWATSTPGPCPARAMPPRFRRSSPRTRVPAHEEGPSRPAPRSSSTSSPPTEPAIRSASNSSPGTAPPTSSPSCCHQACPGPTSKRPSRPQHQAPGRCRFLDVAA